MGWQLRFADSYGVQAPGLVGGDAKKFDVLLERLHLASGSVVEVPEVGVTAIVGANNAGKSTLLREIVNELNRGPGHPESPRLILRNLQLKKVGEANDAIAWIGDHSTFIVNTDSVMFQTSRGASLHPSDINHAWQFPNILGQIAQVTVHYSHAQDRFAFGGGVEMRSAATDPPTQPLHVLQDSRELLDELSQMTDEVFGQRLTLDPLGRMIQLRVGTIDVPAPPVDRISADYRDAMTALPPLDKQGDGMRGFLGQLLPLVTSSFKIIALDEPEAFLHPPQAYGLGKQLGEFAHLGTVQVIVATHDRNLLAGLLDSGGDVSVVRLDRKVSTTRALQLDAGNVRDLWRDPVLKYTNVLDGLFHRVVVLAEAEADCAYYRAAVDIVASNEAPTQDMLFVPTGGKDGMPRVAKSLSAVGVPVVVTADLDILDDVNKLRQLVSSMGRTWTDELRGLWDKATVNIRDQREGAKVADVMTAISAVLDSRKDEQFTPELQRQVTAQLRTRGSRWGPVKEYGVGAFKGDALAALNRLLDQLDKLGIVLVRQGELERLAPEVSATKSGGKWLAAALARRAQANDATQAHAARLRKAAQLVSVLESVQSVGVRSDPDPQTDSPS